MNRVRVLAAGGLMLVFGLVLSTGVAFADPATFSPSASPFGVKFEEWTARWWQFVLSFPTSENPISDITGVRCAIGQSGPVWFLAGSGGEPTTRRCAVPEGTALLFPVLNIVDVNVTNQTADELRAEVAPLMDAATGLTVSVDGDPLRKLLKSPEKYRIPSTVFSITVPAQNFFGEGLAPGTYSPAIGDGFYVMLKPLDVGRHTLRFQGTTMGFSVDTTYLLDVVPTRLE